MSREREAVVIAAATVKTETGTEPTKDEVLEELERQVESRAQKKARLASVLDRGVVHDRLQVDLPPDIHGEWVRNDPLEINRMETLGFRIDDTYAVKRALHSVGDTKAVVGDVIFMITDKENKDLIDEIRQDQFYRINGKPGDDGRKTKEEEDFLEITRKSTGGAIQPVVESTTRAARKSDVAEALKEVAAQTTPIK